MRIILNNYFADASKYRGDRPLTKPVSTCHNSHMMRNNEMRDNLPNENHSHSHFKSDLINEICEVSI
tara:strand:- start:323 stop:523 length:201 start_codon:yes stop_codon:yes gene_type:complete